MGRKMDRLDAIKVVEMIQRKRMRLEGDFADLVDTYSFSAKKEAKIIRQMPQEYIDRYEDIMEDCRQKLDELSNQILDDNV